MQKITALFWDVGGVILTNGWDFPSRKKASQKLGFDLDDFEARHVKKISKLEESLWTNTLKETLFFKPRTFKAQELKAFMFSLSEAHGHH